MDAKQFNINGTSVLLKDEQARNRIAAVEGKLPSDASSSNKLITKTVDDLVNYYLKSETYTKSEVEALIGAIQNFHYEVYAPTGAVTNPQSNVLYLIGPTGSGSDRYEEYVYTNNTWTKIGDTSIDLSGYVTTEALNTALAAYTTTANLTTLLAVLDGKISQLGQKVDGEKYTETKTYSASDQQTYFNIPIASGTKIKVKLSGTAVLNQAWLYADAGTSSSQKLGGINVQNNNEYEITLTYNVTFIGLRVYTLTTPGTVTITVEVSGGIVGDISRLNNKTEQLDQDIDDLSLEINGLSDDVDDLSSEVDDFFGIVTLYNGSTGNPNNASLVRTAVIETNGADFVIIRTSRPNSEGCHYAYGYALTSRKSDIGKTTAYNTFVGPIEKVDVYTNMGGNYIVDLRQYPTCVGIAFTIGEYDSNGVQQTLRIDDFTSYNTQVDADINTEEVIQKYIDNNGGNIVERNYEREIALQAMCRYRKESSPVKDLQLCICTDSHNDTLAVNNAVDAVNGFDTMDGFLHAGDICASYYRVSDISSFQSSLSRLTKPGYIVVGNHDVGNAYYIGYCCDHAQAYDAYIKPMVDKGWLASGEYTANKPYWHHDLADYKIRLIGLYEYDDNLDFNENYWRAITYNSNLPNIALNTAYSIGTQVNVPGYTDYSFEAVQALTTPANFYTTPEKFPSYKVRRGDRVIRQEQAQWFLDTLLATPANYGIVVILHNPFADDAQVMDVKFSQFKSGITAASYSQNDMETDLIGGALAAFASGSNYEENVVMKGDAAYMNTQGGGTYSYTVSKNFASKNTGVGVLGLLGGHSHRDLVWKKGDFVQITPVCATTNIANATGSDIRRADEDGLTKDSLTVISFASGRIGLAKIGVNVTEDGYPRDYEVIKTN